MKPTKYIVRLSVEERSELEAIVKKGKGEASKIRNAQIFLHSDINHEPQSAATIAKMLHPTFRTSISSINKLHLNKIPSYNLDS